MEISSLWVKHHIFAQLMRISTQNNVYCFPQCIWIFQLGSIIYDGLAEVYVYSCPAILSVSVCLCLSVCLSVSAVCLSLLSACLSLSLCVSVSVPLFLSLSLLVIMMTTVRLINTIILGTATNLGPISRSQKSFKNNDILIFPFLISNVNVVDGHYFGVLLKHCFLPKHFMHINNCVTQSERCLIITVKWENKPYNLHISVENKTAVKAML